jgi:hypothetical protein
MTRIYDDTELYYVPPAGVRYTWDAPEAEADTLADGWDPVEELAQMLSDASAAAADPAAVPPGARHRHRTSRRRDGEDSPCADGGQRATHVTVLIAVIALAALAMLGWSITYSYDQLRTVAASVLSPRFARWWPLTVYGPWLVAALSVLRAAAEQRSARRSWGIILGTSATAVALCAGPSSRSLLALVITGIPPVTALVCFWELVGQVSVRQRPRHAAPGEESASAQWLRGLRRTPAP